jgi:hypothetical protein
MTYRTAVVERCGIKIVKRDEGRRVVFGEVMLPCPKYERGQKVPVEELRGLVHFDGGCMTAEAIQQLVDRFAVKRPRIDVEHDGKPRAAEVVETFIAQRGWEPWTEGAWVTGTQFYDDALWQRTETDLHAYSIQFVVRVEDVPIVVVDADGTEREIVLHYFDDTHPQFLSLVGEPATGAMWKIKQRGATWPGIAPVVDREWDADEAYQRVQEWAGDDLGKAAQARAFLTDTSRGLIADVDGGGRLVVVRHAVEEAMRGLDESELSEEDERRAEALLALYGVERQAEADGTTVQTLIMSKEQFATADDATAWATEHDFSADKIDETDESWRLRQRPPEDFDEDSLRTIELADGVQAVVGRLKETEAEEGEPESEEDRFVGSPRSKYGTHSSVGFKGEYEKAWRTHFSQVNGGDLTAKASGPIRGTVRRTEMIAAAMKPKCDLPAAEGIDARGGAKSPLPGDFPEKPSDYGLSQWAKPSDDDLTQEDVQFSCKDLAIIKRAAMAEVKRRIADREAAEEEGRADGESDDTTTGFADFLTADAGSVFDGVDALARALSSLPEGDESAGLAKAMIDDFGQWAHGRIDEAGVATFAEDMSGATDDGTEDAGRTGTSFAALVNMEDVEDKVWRATSALRQIMYNVVSDEAVTDKAGALRNAIAEFGDWMNALVEKLEGDGLLAALAAPPDGEDESVARKGAKMAKKRLDELTALVEQLQALVGDLQPPAAADDDDTIRGAGTGEEPPATPPDEDGATDTETSRSTAGDGAEGDDKAALLEQLEQQRKQMESMQQRLEAVETARSAPSIAEGTPVLGARRSNYEILSPLMGLHTDTPKGD